MISVGTLVVLTWREFDHTPDWPRLGSVGEVIATADSDGDYEVLFPDCIWGPSDPGWYVPAGWLIPLLGGSEQFITEHDEETA